MTKKDNNMTHLRSATFAFLALSAGLGTSVAFAQTDDSTSDYDNRGYAQSRDYGDQLAVPYNRAGHFSCGFNETHTRLERKNCGGSHYNY